MKTYKAVDFVQWVWKTTFGIEHSKSKIKKDLEQGAVRINDRKIKVDDILEFEDEVYGNSYFTPGIQDKVDMLCSLIDLKNSDGASEG